MPTAVTDSIRPDTVQTPASASDDDDAAAAASAASAWEQARRLYPYIPYRYAVDFSSLQKAAAATPRCLPDVVVNDLVHPQTQSILFRLPPEIRLLIYREVLVMPSDTVRLRHASRAPGRRSVLAVTETCRRAQAEAALLFYSANCLYFESHTTAQSFFYTVSSERCNAIRHVCAQVTSAGAALTLVKALAPAQHLRTLRICRTQPARYTSLLDWKVLSAQINTALEAMTGLKRLLIETPGCHSAHPYDVVVEQRLVEVDQTLMAQVQSRC